MKNLFTLLIGILLFVTANAQTPQLAWAKTFGNKSAATDSTSVMKLYTTDNSVYIAGTSDAYGKGNDIVLIKRDYATGDTLWTRHYNGTANGDDQAVDMEINQTTGDVYVTGKSMGISTGYDIVTLKYSSNGTLGWAKRWDNKFSHSDDIPKSIGIDFNGRIIVTTTTFNNNYRVPYYSNIYDYKNDLLILGYDNLGTLNDSILHNLAYVSTLGFSEDFVGGAKVNNVGDVYVAGELMTAKSSNGYGWVFVTGLSTTRPSNYYDYKRLYETSCVGTWSGISVEYGFALFPFSSTTSNDFNYYNAMDLDNSNNVYLAYLNDTIYGAGTGYTIGIAKISGSGCTVWQKKYGSNANYKNLRVNSIKADSSGNVYAAGYEKNSSGNFDWFVIKYNNSGVFQWRKTKNGTGNGNDIPNDIAFDNLQNPVVVGTTKNTGTNKDITIVKYNKLNGTELFSINYDSNNKDECAYNVVVDGGQSILVNGILNSATQTAKMITLKYCNPPVAAGAIVGLTSVCQGQNSVTYTVPAIDYANSYIWTLPTGAIGTSTTNNITVNYSASAVSGNITVKGQNDCSDGATSTLPVIVNATPATPTVTLNGNALHSSSPTGNQWYNQIGAISGATTQDYSPKISGDYYVVVSANGCTSNASNTKNYITGIAPAKTAKSIKVYPNPVTNELVIEIEGNTVKTDFEVLNSLGQVVFSGNIVEKTIVQTSSFTPGVYLIKLESGKTFEFKKIIKK